MSDDVRSLKGELSQQTYSGGRHGGRSLSEGHKASECGNAVFMCKFDTGRRFRVRSWVQVEIGRWRKPASNSGDPKVSTKSRNVIAAGDLPAQ